MWYSVLMKTLEAIQNMLKLKPWTTISEIAALTEKKRAAIVLELNANRDLIRVDQKSGRIVSLSTGARRLAKREEGFENGEIFKAEYIDYGAAIEIKVNGTFPTLDAMRRTYMCGGMCDCYPMKDVLVWDEKVAAELEKLGMKNYLESFNDLTIENEWKEIA